MKLKIALACDHAGFDVKPSIIALLESRHVEIADFGTFSTESTDYPDHVHPAAKALTDGACDLGILVCGSGNGVAITANKYPQVRAALCWNTDLARLARQHNDANAIALPARFISEDLLLEIITAFLDAEFEGGRHARRVGKISSHC